jgi:hypothetical protein
MVHVFLPTTGENGISSPAARCPWIVFQKNSFCAVVVSELGVFVTKALGA